MSKGKKKVVKGPQLASRVLLGKSKKKATGREPARTMRMRFVEPPAKKVGNPFFAFRVPAELHAAFLKYAKKEHPKAESASIAANVVLRDYMAKVTGCDVGGEDE